jgi:hypothetical protein
MKFLISPLILTVLCLSAAIVFFGCDGGDGESSGSVSPSGSGDTTSEGTAILRGNISSFKTAGIIYQPVIPKEESRVARLMSGICGLLLPSAEAAGNREGIVIYIDGSVSRSATTADDGSFEFTDLPPGTYALTFEYEGEEVTYRGNSGQVATITLEGDTVVELLNLRISGGKVNIGNIKIHKLKGDDDNGDSGD